MLQKIKNIYRELEKRLIYHLPHKISHSYLFKCSHHYKMDFSKPLTYDEKIHWHIVNTYNADYGIYADKLLVRNYVTKCGYEKLLVPLIKVYDKASQIDFSALPQKFILMTNHASGSDFYFICNDKKTVDEKEIKKKFKKALSKNYSLSGGCEYHYRKIKPKILCLQLLEPVNQSRLDDYKVVCSYGNPIAILVCKDRYGGRDYYSTNWEYLDYVKNDSKSTVPTKKPTLLSEMLKCASTLSKPFPLARIDFYIVENKLYFGEVTLTPSGGNHSYLTDYGQKELGARIPPFLDSNNCISKDTLGDKK